VIVRKSEAEIRRIAAAGTILADCLDMLAAAVSPGVRTLELDGMAEEFIRGRGGTPTFLGYRGFPGSICASPNDMVVHGIPGSYVVADGDLLSLDVGVTLDGYVADSALTVPIGTVSADALVGHGVGREMHEEPQIPNYGPAGKGPRLDEGMVFAIEPMVNVGDHEVYVGADRWSIFSADGSLSAHFEHTVALTASGPRVLTRRTSEVMGGPGRAVPA
jgi:methionyl aminopeptidase